MIRFFDSFLAELLFNDFASLANADAIGKAFGGGTGGGTTVYCSSVSAWMGGGVGVPAMESESSKSQAFAYKVL
jgi:hypothetical protein